MGVPIEFLRVDAILDEDELDVLDFQAGFLVDLAPQRLDRPLAEFDIPARKAPEMRPYLGANHERLPGRIEDQSADRHDWQAVQLRRFGVASRTNLEFLARQDFPQLPEVLHDQVRFDGPQLIEP